MRITRIKIKHGFTLIEVIVSLLLFTLSISGLFLSIYTLTSINNKLSLKAKVYTSLSLIEIEFKNDPKEFLKSYFPQIDYSLNTEFIGTFYFNFNSSVKSNIDSFDFKLDLKISYIKYIENSNIYKFSLNMSNIKLSDDTSLNIYTNNNFIITYYEGSLNE